MPLSELISTYRSRLAYFERELGQYEQIKNVELPSVTKQISKIEIAISNAKTRLRQALTTENLKEAKAQLSHLESEFSEYVQLKSNLEGKAYQFEVKRTHLAAEVSSASREMWQAKHDELLVSLELPVELLETLGLVLAAKDGMNPGGISLSYSDPIRDKFGSLDKDHLAELKTRLTIEMGLSNPA